jgi:hypothetical protein
MIVFYLVSFFDEESNSASDRPSLIPIHVVIGLQTGSLTAQLSDNPQKVNGLAGITLGTIVRSISCLIAGSILSLVFIWRVALVGMGTFDLSVHPAQAHYYRSACIPLLMTMGYIWLVSFGFD